MPHCSLSWNSWTAPLPPMTTGRILQSGVSAVIVGKPNVGKSTLFNLLSGSQRSIVTEIAGTTRDVVEEQIRLGNVTLAAVRHCRDCVRPRT